MKFGPVIFTDGEYQGRVGCYDNDDCTGEDISESAVVYFGSPLLSGWHIMTSPKSIKPVTTQDLINRQQELYVICRELNYSEDDYDFYLLELNYVDTILVDRLVEAKYMKADKKSSVFISHSSIDKPFARMLATDLSTAGHAPWLDEWEISIGESIPAKISSGLSEANFVIVILSEDSNNSSWVEREWQNKYWDEVNNGQIIILPVLYKNCIIPELLKTKKYADFRENYNNGLETLLSAIKNLSK